MSRLNCTTHFALLLNNSPVQHLSPFYCVSLITVPPWISHSWTAVIAWKYPSTLFNTGFATWMNELRMLSAVWIQIMKMAAICWLILTSSHLGIYYRVLMIMVRCLDCHLAKASSSLQCQTHLLWATSKSRLTLKSPNPSLLIPHSYML